MRRPGGGRNEIDPRFVSLFSIVCKAFPSDHVIDHIFCSLLSGHTRDFNDDVKAIVPSVIKMTLILYKVNVFDLFVINS